jgi:hypothetical protein
MDQQHAEANSTLGLPVHNNPPSPSNQGGCVDDCLLSGSCLRPLFWATFFVVIFLVIGGLKWKGII